MEYISNHQEQCEQFFNEYITAGRKILCVGTLGFSDLCIHFPLSLARFPNVEFLFLVEDRPEVSDILMRIAERNRGLLESALVNRKFRFETVQIVADDTANVAGRRAAKICLTAFSDGYTDIFVDSSSMSRGVCFPIVKQAYELSQMNGTPAAHVVVAGRTKPTVIARSTSSDAPQYVHGFHADMGTYSSDNAIKLWLPQLSEGTEVSLSRIHGVLKPEESCPILPFPSCDPRRGDALIREFQNVLLGDWDVNLRDILYAHESDPTDVCESITRIHNSRAAAFAASTDRPARTVLSPAGSRIGSVGMLLAALRLTLPIMKLTPFHGHLIVLTEGIRDVQTKAGVLTAIPPATC